MTAIAKVHITSHPIRREMTISTHQIQIFKLGEWGGGHEFIHLMKQKLGFYVQYNEKASMKSSLWVHGGFTFTSRLQIIIYWWVKRAKSDKKQGGVYHIGGLAIFILRQKKNYRNSNISPFKIYNLQKFPLKETKNSFKIL
jgi:hypothetical protein